MRSVRRLLCFALAMIFASPMLAEDVEPVDYNRDIRPILSDVCYRCHGPDVGERQTELRLDLRESAFAERDGQAAVVAGTSDASQLYLRLLAEDPDKRMPPVDSNKELKPAQIELIKRWIDEGANWGEHWSFIKPVRAELPNSKFNDHAINAIDRFIFARLEQVGLRPNGEASKERLIRRVTFDLTGLPPTLQEIDAYLADESPDAFERVVDRLLKSNRYGEHRARYWLDVARYGDTHGLHLDNERSIWPYRDWVINAFNENMPFDQFTIEQLAGDLLPNPTLDQQIATGFNRCNVTTSEGGSIAEEYLVRYAVDRVETTATAWMGLTAGCAVCHDHKFDPLSQKEFYQLFSYFYSLTENAMDGNALLPPPVMKVATEQQQEQQQQLSEQLAAIQRQISEAVANVEYVEPEANEDAPTGRRDYVWIEDELPPNANPQGNSPWKFVATEEGPVYSGDRSSTRTAEGLSQHFFTEAKPLLKVGAEDVLFAYVYLDEKNPPKEIMLQFNDGGWEHRAIWGENLIDWGTNGQPSRQLMGELPPLGKWVRLEVPIAKVGLKPGATLNGWAFTQFDGTVYWDRAGINTMTPQGDEAYESFAVWKQIQRTTDNALPKPLQEIVKLEDGKATEEQSKLLLNHFVENVYSKTRDVFDPMHRQLADIRKQIEDLEKAIPATLVMADMPERRQAHLLIRGEYDKKGEPVEPGVPSVFPALPEDAPKNRLALAKWLVDPDHPLTARVTVNRLWQQIFGLGIVRTTEDFGSQGEWPSHPKLLDWLAVEFVESGWDVKQLIKLMVMSATYRQSTEVLPLALEKDPENRLLSRGPRFRMDAEMIRDNALFVSGLLVEHVGGKSVRPYQPEGLWEAVGYSGSNTVRFTQDHGDALYRRSMYTFWKRTAPPPSMQIFDAPSREYCVVRRERTNTPKAALALMNDVQFVEAARNLAERMMKSGESAEARIAFGFRVATARRPEEAEAKVLLGIYDSVLPSYQADNASAQALVSVGESKRDESVDVAELAAWTVVANAILNLDETVTKG
ncbi:MAG: PSD1 domain-containing protein [Planctomycetaceae bacterium]|nr:PSD1 domain-containing protein [Planctomycetales bacterium]MCB9923933.1 PSD1 domain-containing protein [Planctomycetaceae bacterium]